MNSKLQTLLFTFLLSQAVTAQSPDQINKYISTYRLIAISEMQRSGVPASITLAQGIHETYAGTSDLVLASNNHFGIKCKTGWTGQVVYHDDDARGECFRSYAVAEDSYKDHSDYLSQTPRYAFLFKLDPEDYESWAYGLKKAGYATNVKYSQILIKLIRDYDLQRYSLIALGKMTPDQLVAAATKNQPGRELLNGFTDDSARSKPIPVNSYPEGPFTINATKVIFAKAGVSLLSLSTQYEIPLARLLEFNDLNQENVLDNDQLIFLQRKRKSGLNPYHIVQPGESVYSICQMEGIRYENILEYNRLRPGEEPAPGEKIYLQTVTASKPALRTAANVKTAVPAS
jgi:Mannosyl-glycoprotein endo-beta-N-acetylglucosaminidase/LysM domain